MSSSKNPKKGFTLPSSADLFEDTAHAFAHQSTKELRQLRWLFILISLPFLTRLPVAWVRLLVAPMSPFRYVIKRTLFRHFCAGETLESCQEVITHFKNHHMTCVLDYASEHEKHPKAYDHNVKEILQMMHYIHKHPDLHFAVVKLSALGDTQLMGRYQKALSADEEEALRGITERLHQLCELAHQYGLQLLLDAEEWYFQDFIDDIAHQMMLKYNQKRPMLYNTFQMYRHDALGRLEAFHSKCQRQKVYFAVKLVRGAYMEQENLLAKQEGRLSPIHASKEACDRDFNKALDYCSRHHRSIALFAATHNAFSNHYLRECLRYYSIPKDHKHIHFSQLYGMGNPISYRLAQEGYRVTKYVPYGPLEAVFPYLYRRMQENRSMRGQTSRELRTLKNELQRRRLQKKTPT